MTRLPFPKFIACLAFGISLSLPVSADTNVKRLAPGVTLTQEIDKTTPLVINVIDVDLRAPGVHLGVGVGQDRISGLDPTHGREDVSRYARRHHILAAVNADFFPFTGDPLGVGIKDGELFSEPYTGSAKGGPRVTVGVTPDGHGVVFDTLGFLGDLQTQDGQRTFVNGINRVVNTGEIVAYTPFYGQQTSARPGGTEVIIQGVNLPVRANKLIVGRVSQVITQAAAPAAIPGDGLVLSGAPGVGADFLAQHVHPGERIGFVLAVAPVGNVADGVKIAALPRTTTDLPSRAGEGINRQAFLWANVQQAVGGGPRLLTDGQVTVDGVTEGFDTGFTDYANPRTAAGLSKDGRHFFLLTVDGRQSISKGVNLTDLALILKRYGAWNAVNLDGGGSTSLAVGGMLVNSPEGTGSERPVADMLLVESDTPDLEMPDDFTTPTGSNARLLLPVNPVPVGSATALKVGIGSKIISGNDARILWQGAVSGGVGFVNQRGYFIPLKPGTGAVTALFQGHVLTGSVTVQSPAPVVSRYSLHADFTPDPGGAANRSQLTIRILDQNGKPLAGTVVRLIGTGGTPDAPSVTTDADGQATIGVTWDSVSGGTIRAQAGALSAVTASQPTK
jgi:exopolysaccharide biosynthesis protein